jgi:hypothetical protein
MDQLTNEIYIQLLELYQYDLEVELMCEKLKNVKTSNPPITVPFPWEYPSPNPWNQPPPYYGPPYKVTCSTIQQNDLKYSEDWDAWYDPKENVWVEDKCSDPTCTYCAGRPERPLS